MATLTNVAAYPAWRSWQRQKVVVEPDGEDKCVLLRNSAAVLHCCVLRRVGAEIRVEVDAVDNVADAGVDAPFPGIGGRTSVPQGALCGASGLCRSLLR